METRVLIQPAIPNPKMLMYSLSTIGQLVSEIFMLESIDGPQTIGML